VAGFGLTAVSNLLVRQQTTLQIVGGVFLCYLGIKTFLSRPAGQPAATRNAGLTGAYISTLFLTLTNPMTILSFAAVFAGLGLGSGTDDYIAATFLVSGVFAGSAIWWLMLSSAVGVLRGKLDLQWLPWLNRLSGLVLAVFGLIALCTLKD
jgi:threonine/homoserine/homoserine lactone efflux protein